MNCGDRVNITRLDDGTLIIAVNGVPYTINPGSVVTCDPNGFGIMIDGVLCQFPQGNGEGDNVVTGLAFDDTDNVLTLSQSAGPDISVDLTPLVDEGWEPPVGAEGQVLGFDADGNVIAITPEALEFPVGTEGQVVGYGPDGELTAVDLPSEDTPYLTPEMFDGDIQETVAQALAQNLPVVANGDYTVAGSIPGFHDISWFGRGILRRSGASTVIWRFNAKAAGIRQFHVAVDGDDENDGLNATFPTATIQRAFDYITRHGPDYHGHWRVMLAAGTYVQSASLENFQAENALLITAEGATETYNTVTISGSSDPIPGPYGLGFSNAKVTLRFLRFHGWRGLGGVGSGDLSAGVMVNRFSTVWSDRCSYNDCANGFYARQSRIYHGGGSVVACDVGAVAFANSQFTFGYDYPTLFRTNLTALHLRDGSCGVTDNCVFQLNNVGCRFTNGSHSRVSNCTFEDSVQWDILDNSGISQTLQNNTHTPNKRYLGQIASLPLDKAYEIRYNADTGGWGFGEQSLKSYRWHFVKEPNTATATSTSTIAIEDVAPVIGLNASGQNNSVSGLHIAQPGVSSEAYLLYQFAGANPRWSFAAGGELCFRLGNTAFTPMGTSGSKNLGGNANKFNQVHLTSLRYENNLFETVGNASPEGTTSAAPGSTVRDTNNGELYLKKSGTGNTGWEALATKADLPELPVGTEGQTLVFDSNDELEARQLRINDLAWPSSLPALPITTSVYGMVAISNSPSGIDPWASVRATDLPVGQAIAVRKSTGTLSVQPGTTGDEAVNYTQWDDAQLAGLTEGRIQPFPGDDLNDITQRTGLYRVLGGSASVENLPPDPQALTHTWHIIYIRRSDDQGVMQLAMKEAGGSGVPSIWVRSSTGVAGDWSAWTRLLSLEDYNDLDARITALENT